MKKTLRILFVIVTLICVVSIMLYLIHNKNHKANLYSIQLTTSSQTTCIFQSNVVDNIVTSRTNLNEITIHKPTSLKIGGGNETIFEFDHGLPQLESPGKRSDAHKYASMYGADGKITLKVVDSNGVPVEGANVNSWFWMGDLISQGSTVNTTTDLNGLAELMEKNIGDISFNIKKEGYYTTRLRYYFSILGHDCVKDGRWLPWNPTLEVVLKEKRNPVDLKFHKIFKTFPLNTYVGFDFSCNDFIEPYGNGKNTNVVFTVSGECRSNVDYWYNLDVKFVNKSGFIRMNKDSFSELKVIHEVPNGIQFHDEISFNRTYNSPNNVFINTKTDFESYYIFRVNNSNNQTFDDDEFMYGFISRGFEGGIGNKDTNNNASVFFEYYINPVIGEKNIEIKIR